MMKLGTLWSLDKHLASDGSSPFATTLASHWELDPDPVTFFRTSSNSIFRARLHGELVYLRISPATERATEALLAELELLDTLADSNLPVVRAVPSRHRKFLESHEVNGQSLHAVVFAAVPGEQRDLDDLNPGDIERWGESLGRLHSTSSTLEIAPRERTPRWQMALNRAVSEPGIPDTIREESRRLQAILANLPRTNSTWGLLHRDFELDNLRWSGDQIGILDFDDFEAGWFGLDIAKALNDLFEEGETVANSPRIQAFIQGYRSQHPLSESDLDLLPDFVSLERLHAWFRISDACDLELGPKHPDWLHRLDGNLRRWTQGYVSSLSPM